MSGAPPRTWDEFIAHFRSRLRVSARGWNGTQCLEWTGAIGKAGYGNLCHDKCWWSSHRLAWFLKNGPIPEGKMVCHHCDNPPCVNDEHLFIGTAKTNHDDMRSKVRESAPPRFIGSQHSEAKLNEELVAVIKGQCAAGVSNKALAKRFGVAQQLISRIARGEIWTHVPGPIVKSTAIQLDEQQVDSIRAARSSGIRLKVLAAQYGVSRQAISKIARGERWARASGPITKCKQGARS